MPTCWSQEVSLHSGEEIGEYRDSLESSENIENLTICCPYRYRTMAKTLSCDYTMDLPNFEHISHHGKDFISKLLVLDPKVICLRYQWQKSSKQFFRCD